MSIAIKFLYGSDCHGKLSHKSLCTPMQQNGIVNYLTNHSALLWIRLVWSTISQITRHSYGSDCHGKLSQKARDTPMQQNGIVNYLTNHAALIWSRLL